jgi:hypothetical protein
MVPRRLALRIHLLANNDNISESSSFSDFMSFQKFAFANCVESAGDLPLAGQSPLEDSLPPAFPQPSLGLKAKEGLKANGVATNLDFPLFLT